VNTHKVIIITELVTHGGIVHRQTAEHAAADPAEAWRLFEAHVRSNADVIKQISDTHNAERNGQ
jgi:hypothetical protein